MLRAAAGGCEYSQITIALEILGLATGEDQGHDLLCHLYALCYARMAAAQGSYEALNLAAHLSAALANMVGPTLLAPRVPGFQGDAMALFDVAADRAPPEAFDATERNLQTVTASSDLGAIECAIRARKFWGMVVQPDVEPY